MKNRVGLLLFALLTVPLLAQTDILRPQTLAAWNEYVGAANARLEHDVRQKNSFLLIDHDPGLRARLRGGAIVISPVGNNGHTAVPHGLITDWVGDVFVPNTTISDVVAQLNDYDRYRQFFNPTRGGRSPAQSRGSRIQLFNGFAAKGSFCDACPGRRLSSRKPPKSMTTDGIRSHVRRGCRTSKTTVSPVSANCRQTKGTVTYGGSITSHASKNATAAYTSRLKRWR